MLTPHPPASTSRRRSGACSACTRPTRPKLRVGGSFSEPHELEPGLEAFPLPGHTAGFTVSRWKGERGSYLYGGGRDLPIDLETDYLLLNESLGDHRPPLPFGAKERTSAVGQALDRVARKHKIAV